MRRTWFILGTMALSALAAPAFAQTALRPDQLAFRDLYKELVETNTTLSSGSCTLAEAKARDLLPGFEGGLIIVRLVSPESTWTGPPPNE